MEPNAETGMLPAVHGTLAHYVAQVSWDELRAALDRIYYPIPDFHFPRYQHALAILKALTPATLANDDTIDIVVERQFAEETGEPVADISGADVTRPEDLTRYAIQWTEWDVFLGKAVRVQPELELGNADILAYLLWDLTWSGWTPWEQMKNLESLRDTFSARIIETGINSRNPNVEGRDSGEQAGALQGEEKDNEKA